MTISVCSALMRGGGLRGIVGDRFNDKVSTKSTSFKMFHVPEGTTFTQVFVGLHNDLFVIRNVPICSLYEPLFGSRNWICTSDLKLMRLSSYFFSIRHQLGCSLQSKVALFADRVQCRKALGERLLPFFKYRQESMGHPFRSLWNYGLFKPQYILLPALQCHLHLGFGLITG